MHNLCGYVVNFVDDLNPAGASTGAITGSRGLCGNKDNTSKKVLFINNIIINIIFSTVLEYKGIDFYCSFSGGNLSTGSEPKRLTEDNDNGAT